jgi:iron complex outermembrane receptor protein
VLGGLVNVISESIPTARSQKPSGAFTFDAGSGNAEVALSGNVMFGAGPLVFRAGASGRTAGDVKTPQGPIENSQARGGFADAAVSWVGDRGYVGVSYAYDSTRYGIPFIEGGSIELTPRRQSLDVRAEGQNWHGPITSARASAAIRRYQHDDRCRCDCHFGHQRHERVRRPRAPSGGRPAAGHLRGVGVHPRLRGRGSRGALSAGGPAGFRGLLLRRGRVAADPPAVRRPLRYTAYQAGNGLPDRTFNEFSGSVGVLVHPSPSTTVAVSLARVTRAPALEELYFEGPHPGNFAYEIGNAWLPPETSSGIDVSFRWQFTRASGEVSYFRNTISNYVLRDFAGVFEGDLPVINFVSSEGVMQGFEAHTDVQLTRSLTGEITADFVYGQVANLDEPMPRIPPFRVRGGVRYQRDALQVGGTVVVAAGQDRVFPPELPTSGYGLLNLFAAYSFARGRMVNTIIATLNNATNELYRNHLSFINQFAPGTGRNVRIAYSVGF